MFSRYQLFSIFSLHDYISLSAINLKNINIFPIHCSQNYSQNNSQLSKYLPNISLRFPNIYICLHTNQPQQRPSLLYSFPKLQYNLCKKICWGCLCMLIQSSIFLFFSIHSNWLFTINQTEGEGQIYAISIFRFCNLVVPQVYAQL